MDAVSESAETLRCQIAAAEEELKILKEKLAALEDSNYQKSLEPASHDFPPREEKESTVPSRKWPLSSEEYMRYGRQMIIPNIGLQGKSSSSFSAILINSF